ncbi:MAG: hypothetical protein ACPGXY_02510 [Alphaproteobacteria bacterium]
MGFQKKCLAFIATVLWAGESLALTQQEYDNLRAELIKVLLGDYRSAKKAGKPLAAKISDQSKRLLQIKASGTSGSSAPAGTAANTRRVLFSSSGMRLLQFEDGQRHYIKADLRHFDAELPQATQGLVKMPRQTFDQDHITAGPMVGPIASRIQHDPITPPSVAKLSIKDIKHVKIDWKQPAAVSQTTHRQHVEMPRQHAMVTVALSMEGTRSQEIAVVRGWLNEEGIPYEERVLQFPMEAEHQQPFDQDQEEVIDAGEIEHARQHPPILEENWFPEAVPFEERPVDEELIEEQPELFDLHADGHDLNFRDIPVGRDEGQLDELIVGDIEILEEPHGREEAVPGIQVEADQIEAEGIPMGLPIEGMDQDVAQEEGAMEERQGREAALIEEEVPQDLQEAAQLNGRHEDYREHVPGQDYNPGEERALEEQSDSEEAPEDDSIEALAGQPVQDVVAELVEEELEEEEQVGQFRIGGLPPQDNPFAQPREEPEQPPGNIFMWIGRIVTGLFGQNNGDRDYRAPPGRRHVDQQAVELEELN